MLSTSFWFSLQQFELSVGMWSVGCNRLEGEHDIFLLQWQHSPQGLHVML